MGIVPKRTRVECGVVTPLALWPPPALVPVFVLGQQQKANKDVASGNLILIVCVCEYLWDTRICVQMVALSVNYHDILGPGYGPDFGIFGFNFSFAAFGHIFSCYFSPPCFPCFSAFLWAAPLFFSFLYFYFFIFFCLPFLLLFWFRFSAKLIKMLSWFPKGITSWSLSGPSVVVVSCVLCVAGGCVFICSCGCVCDVLVGLINVFRCLHYTPTHTRRKLLNSFALSNSEGKTLLAFLFCHEVFSLRYLCVSNKKSGIF